MCCCLPAMPRGSPPLPMRSERAAGPPPPYPIDLADAKAIEDTSARIAREVGIPDVLINNAGAGRWLPLLKTTAKEALAMIEVPYLAAFNLTRAFLPYMLARRSGTIACVTSPASYLVWPNANAYIAARQALKGFTDALRSEVQRHRHHRDARRARHGRDPLLGAQPRKPREFAEDQSAARADAHRRARQPRRSLPAWRRRKRTVVKPAILRALFLLNALAPELVTHQLRRSIRKRPESDLSAQPCLSASTANRRTPRRRPDRYRP